jgi:FKBP-type peptidyl-prolyl cis-trans isomerase SlyD
MHANGRKQTTICSRRSEGLHQKPFLRWTSAIKSDTTMANMTIEQNSRVVLDYTLRGESDDVIDSSDGVDGEPMVYIHGYGMISPGLEQALVGLKVGDTKELVLSPQEAFGERDEAFTMEVNRAEMPQPDAVAVGDEFVTESETGEQVVMQVVSVSDDKVVVDGNHPLAGLTVRYSVTIREVRQATEEELALATAGPADSHEEHDPAVLSDEDVPS